MFVERSKNTTETLETNRYQKIARSNWEKRELEIQRNKETERVKERDRERQRDRKTDNKETERVKERERESLQ